MGALWAFSREKVCTGDAPRRSCGRGMKVMREAVLKRFGWRGIALDG